MISLLLFLLFMQNPGPSLTGAHAPPVTSTITYAGAKCDNFVASGTSVACTLTVASGATQTLVIYTSVPVGTTMTPTATCGTVSTIRSVNWNSVDAETAYALYIPNATSGSCTVTIGSSLTGNFSALMVADFAGANAATPIDNASCTSTPFCSGVGVSGTAITNGTITTANPGEMVVGMAENYSLGNMPTTVAGFTQISSTTASSFYAMNYAPATGSYTPSFTGTFPWVAMAVALTV